MKSIEEMIKELCPEGVEYVKLGEVCDVLDSQRKPISKSKRVPGTIPYYGANGIQDYIEGYIFDGTFLLIGEDGSVINEDKSPVVHWATGKIWVNNHAHILSEIKEIALLRYLFYAVKCTDVSDLVFGTPPKINQANMRSIRIPLPPLPIQQQIADTLDKFTSLISNIDKQIELRQKQFEYYREKLLTFDEGECEWKTLPDISENRDKQRKPIASSKRVKGEYPYYGASGIVDYVEGYIFDGDYLLVSEDGANLIARSSPIAFCISGKNWVNNHAHVIKFDNSYTRRLIEIYLNSIDLTPWITGGAQPKLNQEKLNSIPVPVPSLSRQESIVSTIDKFEAVLVNLKRERELRQKQYEYYREKLLTF